VPIVLVQDVLAKDQREELSRLNALEIFNNLNPVQLNVNNLPLGKFIILLDILKIFFLSKTQKRIKTSHNS